MKNTALLVAGCSLFLAANAQAQTKKKPVAHKPATHATSTTSKASAGYLSAGDGLEYKVLTHGTGVKSPIEGDIIDVHVIQKIGDSVMLNTIERNQGKPITFQLQKPAFKGDVMTGILKMKEGDSTLFRISLDTLSARAKQPIPPFAKKGDKITWSIKLVHIKTAEEIAVLKKQAEDAQKERAKEQEAKVKAQASIDDSLIQKYIAEKGIKNAQKTPSGLYYVVIKDGTGPNAANGQKVSVNYTGQNMQGEIFDSNVDSAFHHVDPIKFDVGTHQMISGWDEGVTHMNKGMKAKLIIPSAMAYGPNARDAKIPANAVLIFDLEMLDIL